MEKNFIERELSIVAKKKSYFIFNFRNNAYNLNLWINSTYKGFFSELNFRSIFKLKKGKNTIKIVSSNSSNVLIDFIEFSRDSFDDYNDIKNYYLSTNLVNNNLKFNLYQNNERKSKIIKINIIETYLDFKKREVTSKNLKTKIVKVNTNYSIKLNTLKNNYWVFLKYNNNKIRVFLKDANLALKDLYDNYKQNYIFFSKNDNVYIEEEYGKICNRNDIKEEIKFYLFYHYLERKIINKKDLIIQDSYYLNLDQTKRNYSSIIEPKNMNLILILSSNNWKTYIESYVKYYKKGYDVVEASLLGNNHGNYIGEEIILQLIKHLENRKKYKNIYLFGYSSCGTAVMSMLSKYPNIFTGGLSVAGSTNYLYLDNISHNSNLISFSGDLEKEIAIYDFIKNFSNNINIYNFCLCGHTHTSISSVMRNKRIINKVIKLRKRKSIEYYSDYFTYNNPFEDLKIIKKKEDKVYIIKRNKNRLWFYNVKYFYLNDEKEYIINNIKIINKGKTYYEIIDDLIFIVDNPLCNNGLGILNIYRYPLIFNVNNDKLKLLNGLLFPKYMTHTSKVNISYKNCDENNFDLLKSKDFSLVHYNIGSTNLIVEVFKYYFEYKGKKYYGDYSIIQIIKRNNVYFYDLYINDNNELYSKKNFFLKNVVIPSDLYFNSIYNNIVIIFYNLKYYCIYDYCDEIEEIKWKIM